MTEGQIENKIKRMEGEAVGHYEVPLYYLRNNIRIDTGKTIKSTTPIPGGEVVINWVDR